MNLTEKQERLLELLMAAPPDINGIEEKGEIYISTIISIIVSNFLLKLSKSSR